MKNLIAILAVALTCQLSAQVAINETGNSADPSAVLDINSDSRGFLTPKMTLTQRNGLGAPPQGTMIYQTDAGTEGVGFYYYKNSSWSKLNVNEPYRGFVQMNHPAPPIEIVGSNSTLISSGFTLANLSPAEIGKFTVTHPPFGLEPTVIATAEYLPTGLPPLPDDYCDNGFTNDCDNSGAGATHQYVDNVSILWPAGNFALGSPIQWYLSHCPTAASCNIGITDYQIHYKGIGASAVRCAPVVDTDAYNSSFPSMPAGSSFDLYLNGNAASPAQLATIGMSINVYVDWNQDGDFYDDPGGPLDEQIVSSPVQIWPNAFNGPGPNQTLFAITIPPGAATGTTTMRVVASPFAPAASNPCIINDRGSTRDYQLTITGGVTPVFPGANRVCNVKPTVPYTNTFQVDCFNMQGNFVLDKLHLVVKPN